MTTIAGLATARGLAIGPVFVYRGGGDIQIPEYEIEQEDVEREVARLVRARKETRRDIENLISTLRERTDKTDVSVFECHLLILDDPLLTTGAERAIRERKLNAEAAVRLMANESRRQFSQMNDPYFRERIRDLDDVERRLLGQLTGFGNETCLELKHPSIVVADDLTPSETVRLPRECVLGFAMNGGSTTSHVALLARAMGIPAVTGLGDITAKVTAGTTILLDGTNGAVTLNPTESAIADFNNLIRRQREIVESAVSGAIAGTLKDGGEILMLANVHPGVQISGLRELGARGVGLYRSEYLWINRESEPNEDEQFEAYRDVARLATVLGKDAPVTIRVLDVGGDKLVRGISEKENNPFLGNRSIRYLLSNPRVFKTQLRAILRASAHGKVRLLYPMISCVEELKEAAQIFESTKEELDREGVPYDRKIPVGAMIEVPSAAINAMAIASYVDFFSIGTNDLIQYTMAADRGNEAVAYLYQPTNPAVLKLVSGVVSAAKAKGIRVGVCGESAADPVVGVLWVAMGVDELSMSAMYIPVISRLLSRLTRNELDEYAAQATSAPITATAQEIFDSCRRWLIKKIPDLDDMVI